MVFIFPIGFLGIIFLVCLATGTKFAYDFLNWFVDFWWIFAILSAIKCMIVNIIFTNKNQIAFLISDIIKTSLIYFVLVTWANECLRLFGQGGLGGLLTFILEIVGGAIIFGGFLCYGYGVCVGTRGEDEEIGIYISGVIYIFIAALICVGTYYL